MNGPIPLPAGGKPAPTPFDLHGLKTYDLRSRPSKVFYEDLGRPLRAGATVAEWFDSLPRQLVDSLLSQLADSLPSYLVVHI